MLKYDSQHGQFKGTIEIEEDGLVVNGKKVKNTAGVTPLVVVPGNQLDKVVIERDTGLGVEDG